MARKKRSGASFKNFYMVYKSTSRKAVNAKKKLERHIKNNPDDYQAERALKTKNFMEYRRRKPTHRGINKVQAVLGNDGKVKHYVKVMPRIKGEKPKHMLTVAEQFFNLGIIDKIPANIERVINAK